MSAINLIVRDDVSLTEFRASDKSAIVRQLNDREIFDRTLRLPFPYTEADADFFLELVAATTEKHGEPVHFAIRGADGALIGGLGFEGLTIGHQAEIGYWLGRDWWGRNIMTNVVSAAVAHALARWKLVRITAYVFPSNPASGRVLEKNGFEFEGLLRKHRLKQGKFLDSRLYALVR